MTSDAVVGSQVPLVSTKRNSLGLAWKIGVSLVTLAAVIGFVVYARGVKSESLLLEFASIPRGTVVMACCAVLGQLAAQGSRLWAITKGTLRTPWRLTLSAFATGQFANAFLPVRLGDIMKVAQLGRASGNESQHFGLATGAVFVADKAVDIGALVLILLVVAPLQIAHASLPRIPVLSVGVGTAAVAASVFLLRQRQFHWAVKLRSIVGNFFRAIIALKNPRILVPALLFGVAAWMIEAFSFYVLTRGIGHPLTYAHCIVVLAVLNFGIAIPVSFANLGPFEASIVFGMGLFAIPAPAALAVATVHHSLQLLCVCLAALVSWFARPRREFRVTADDKARAFRYYDSRAHNYNQAVARGPLQYFRHRESSAILGLANFGRPGTRTMIDVGCGGGAYAMAAKAAGMHVTATDISSRMIAAVRNKVDESFISDLDSLEENRKFDIVVCSGVLDFVLSPATAFRNLCSLVDERSCLVVLVPRAGWAGFIYRLEKRILGNMHVNLYQSAWFAAHARQHGLCLTDERHPLPINMVLRFERRSPRPTLQDL